ncbi:MAG: LicD family protein [Dehalococcoidales bacterium]
MVMDNPADERKLDEILDRLDTIDVAAAGGILKEIKQVLDEAGVTFFLRQGTCLGAIRDGALIPWDDDIDVGSVIGLNGFDEAAVEPIVRTFAARGFLTRIERKDHYLYVPLVKSGVRADWCSYWVIDDSVFMYPGIRIPIRFLTDLEEIEFLGERFHVPNPPEEYLRVKYGEEWRTPKRAGDYESDIIDRIPDTSAPGRTGGLKQFLVRNLLRGRAARFLVLDEGGNACGDARVRIAGLGHAVTDRQGIARLYVPRADHYALIFTIGGHDDIRYVERVVPGETLVYRPNEELRPATDEERR